MLRLNILKKNIISRETSKSRVQINVGGLNIVVLTQDRIRMFPNS